MQTKKDLTQAEYILASSQDWILTSMQSLNFPGNDNGVCKGVSHRSIKAFHSKQLDDYCDLLDQVQAIFKEEKAALVENPQQKLDIETLYSLLKENIRQRIDALSNKDKINEILFSINKQYEHHESEGYLIDHDFKEQGLIRGYEEGDTLGSPYSLEEIAEYFRSIQVLNKPISLALGGGSELHFIAVTYDPNQKIWTVIDANPPVRALCTTVEELADKIVKALNFNSVNPTECCFLSFLYFSSKDQGVENAVEAWVQERELYLEIKAINTNENFLAELAFNQLKKLAIDVKNKEQLLKMKYTFINTLNKEQTLDFYVANKVKPLAVTDKIRNTLDLAYETYAKALTVDDFIKSGKKMENDIEQAFRGTPKDKTVSSSFGFFKSMAYSAPFIIAVLGLYMYRTNTRLEENVIDNSIDMGLS